LTGTAGDRADPAQLAIPELCLVALVGASGSGKSTFARRQFSAFEVGDLLRHAFREWDATTSDSHEEQIAGAVIFLDNLGRQARQCPVDARAIHDAGFLDKIHVRGYYHSRKKAQKAQAVFFIRSVPFVSLVASLYDAILKWSTDHWYARFSFVSLPRPLTNWHYVLCR
jgi:predicted ATPase